MDTLKLPPPVWVDRKDSFAAMLADLRDCSILAVDTESNSLYAYQEQVCLIQFSTETTDYLMDPLALQDISSLAELFDDQGIEKVFHAAEYDLLCLNRDFGFTFKNIFDTMLASRILGREKLGLGSILQEEFDLVVDKKYQKADWGKRPLKPEMLEYARLDTHFLIKLRHRLKAALEEKGRWALAEEDFARLSQISAPQADNEQEKCWKVLGNHKFTNEQLAVLQALCEYREQRARLANVPVFKILNNSILLSIAQAMPEDLDALGAVNGVSAKIVQRHGAQLLQVVQKGLQQKPYRRKLRHSRPENGYVLRLDAMRNWRKKAALQIGVPSDVILPRNVMMTIVEAEPKSLQDLQQLLADLPWRYTHFGEQILAALQNASGG